MVYPGSLRNKHIYSNDIYTTVVNPTPISTIKRNEIPVRNGQIVYDEDIGELLVYKNNNWKELSSGLSENDQINLTDTTNSTNYLNGALTIAGGVGITKDVNIHGNLTVDGILSSTDIITSNIITISDPIIKLADNNTANLVDIGIYGLYNDGSSKFTGLFRDSSDSGKWKIVNDLVTEPTITFPSVFTPATLSIGSIEFKKTSTSGTINLSSPTSVPSSYNIVFPSAQGSSGSTLINVAGDGVLQWQIPAIYNQTLNTTDNVTFNTVTISSTTQSTSTSTGALLVAGGVGIGKTLTSKDISITNTLSVSGISDILNTTESTSTNTGSLKVAGGVGIAKNVYVGGQLRAINTTASTSTSTGSLIVSGGVGISGKLNITSNIDINSLNGTYRINGNTVLRTGSGSNNTFLGKNTGANEGTNNTLLGTGTNVNTSTSSGIIAIGISNTSVSAVGLVNNGLYFHKSLATMSSGSLVQYDSSTGQMGPLAGSINITTDINSKGDQITSVGTYNPTKTMKGLDIQGDYLYITDTTTPALRIVNLRDKTTPTEVSATTLSFACRHIKIQGRYAYLPTYSSGSVTVVDILNPSVPTIINTYSIFGASGVNNSMYISSEFLYVGYGSKIHIIDIKNPNSLLLRTTISLVGTNKGLVVQGFILYVITDTGSATNLYSIDVSDINSPTTLQQISSVIAEIPNSISFQGNLLYIISSASLSIIDIKNPLSMTVLSTTAIPGTPVSIYIQGDYAYILSSSSSTVGLSVYEISNPLSVTLVTNTNPGSSLGADSYVTSSGKYIYTSNVNAQTMQIHSIEGSSFQSMQVGGLEVNQLHIKDNLLIDSNIYASGGLVVGTGLISHGSSCINGSMNINGRVSVKVVTTTTTPYSLDNDYILNTNVAGTCEVNLPPISNNIYLGVTYMIIKLNSNTVNINANGSDKIHGVVDVSTISLTDLVGQRIVITNNGVNWYVM